MANRVYVYAVVDTSVTPHEVVAVKLRRRDARGWILAEVTDNMVLGRDAKTYRIKRGALTLYERQPQH